MSQFLLIFLARPDSGWPPQELSITQPSCAMAERYAAQLLQAHSNTLFHTVRVVELDRYGDAHGPVSSFELVTTRVAECVARVAP